MRATTLFCSVLATIQCWAQQIPLSGSVVLLNSRVETGQKIFLGNASIRAPFAKPVTSDKEGRFALSFEGVASGSSVSIQVSKPGFAVVNTRELDEVIAGRTTALQVVMADAEKLAVVQAKFHVIATGSIMRHYERELQKLRDPTVGLEERLATASRRMNDTLTTLGDARAGIAAERDAALSSVQELARTLATVDLDEASDLYRSAHGAFARGEVDSALVLLGGERLGGDMEAALRQEQEGKVVVTKARERIRQVFQAYELRADVLKATLASRQSVRSMQEMLTIIAENPDVFGALEEARILEKLGEEQVLLEELEPALVTFQRCIDLRKPLLGEESVQLSYPVNGMGNAWLELGEFEQARLAYRRALHLQTKLEGRDWREIGTIQLNLATALMQLGRNDSAEVVAREAIQSSTRPDGPVHHDVAQAYDRLGIIHHRQHHHDSALVNARRAISIYEELNDPGNGRSLANAYNNLSTALVEVGAYEDALATARSSKEMAARIDGPEHAMMAARYNNIGAILRNLLRYDEAITNIDSGLVIIANVLGRDHPYYAALLYNKAQALGMKGENAMALEAFTECYVIDTTYFGARDPRVADDHTNMGEAYGRMGEHERAMQQFRTALDIRVEAYGPEDVQIAISRADIGRCLYDLGQQQAAWDELQASFKISPNDEAAWYLYRISIDRKEEKAALDHLLVCARMRYKRLPAEAPKRIAAIAAIKGLATKLDRRDVLEEFHLD